MLDKEASVTVNGATGIVSIALIFGLHLSPEAAASVAFIMQGIAAFVVRQNVFSKHTVRARKIK